MENITLSSQIIELLNYLGEKMGVAIDWTNSNMMPYLESIFSKYINYFFLSRVIPMGLILIVAIFFTIISVRYLKRRTDFNPDKYFMDCLYVTFLIISVIVLIIVFIVLFFMLPDLIACWTFPEKIILDYLKSFVNGG